MFKLSFLMAAFAVTPLGSKARLSKEAIALESPCLASSSRVGCDMIGDEVAVRAKLGIHYIAVAKAVRTSRY